MAEHEVIARIIFAGADGATQAADLMAQIESRITNATVAGIGSSAVRTSYARHEDDGVLQSMLHVDEWGIVRQGEYIAPDPYPVWIAPTGAHDSYPLTRLDGEVTRVVHNGQPWQSTYDGLNSWEPGVFGWTQI